MQHLAAAYPGDLDAASFYALALLGTCEDGRDVPTYMRAAAVVEEVFAKSPRHPRRRRRPTPTCGAAGSTRTPTCRSAPR
jgi:hypothetical protein